MAKRLMVLLMMLALASTTAVPAFAQEQQYGGGEVMATGVLVGELPADVATNGTHSISDEATGELYALRGAGADLDPYVGERVTVRGTLTPGEGPASGEEFGGSLPSIDVTSVEPARLIDEATVCDELLPSGEPNPEYDPADPLCPVVEPPPGGGEISVSFELSVKGEPPQGTRLYAAVSQGVAVYETAALTDPDGDGLHTGAMTLSEEVFDFGAYPISVQFLSHQPGAGPQTIKDFGEVEPEDGDVFSAEFSFDGTEPPPPPANTVMAAGTIERMQPDTGYVLTDGPQGAILYGLTSASPGMDFAAYEGRMVAVYGAVSGELSEGGPFPVLVVTRIEPVDVDPVGPAPVDPVPVEPAPGGGTDDDGSGGVVSGDTSNAGKKDGVSSGADGGGSDRGSVSPIAKVLPVTGGVLPIAGGVGALLIFGGIAARRMFG